MIIKNLSLNPQKNSNFLFSLCPQFNFNVLSDEKKNLKRNHVYTTFGRRDKYDKDSVELGRETPIGKPEQYQCKWAPSYVGLCDIYDRDEPDLSILSIIQRRKANPDVEYPETYTEGLLKLAQTNSSVGLECKAPGKANLYYC
jgi:hypothetical protein